MVDQQALQPWWLGVSKQPCRTPTMSDDRVNNSNNQRVRIYLSCICFYCFSYNYSLTRVYLFVLLNSPLVESFSSINNIDTSSINIFVTMTSSLQVQKKTTLKRDPTMAMTIATVTRRQQHQNAGHHGIADQQATPLHQRRRVLYQHICHHDVLLPSKCNRNTTAATTTTTGTQSDNGNGNRDTQITTQ